jgi:hypothetical protein
LEGGRGLEALGHELGQAGPLPLQRAPLGLGRADLAGDPGELDIGASGAVFAISLKAQGPCRYIAA